MIQPDIIRALVFDLDGTLYVSSSFEEAVWKSVSRYTAELFGCSPDEAGDRLHTHRDELTAARGTVQTIAAAIESIGGSIQEMHHRFATDIEPTEHMEATPEVTALMDALKGHYTSWLLTNNNTTLTGKILEHLQLETAFHRVITVNETWRPKPNQDLLSDILAALALPPEQILFVGDRYDIDLRLPAAAGCQVHLTKTVEELLALGQQLLPQR
ncbi:MAG: HAD family hydrolase [Trichlorobacter sp.]